MKNSSIQKLADMIDGTEADIFVLFVSREKMFTREKKPYFRVKFRDETREITFPIWENTPHFLSCQTEWTPGKHYKIRAIHRMTNYGAQLDILRIREVVPKDVHDGFSPTLGMALSPFPPEETYEEILSLAAENISDSGLRAIIEYIFEKYHEALLSASAAQGKHHATVGGLLEHTRNVLRTSLWLAERYEKILPDMQPPLNKSVVAAGAILHDIGKLRELTSSGAGFTYTAEGTMLGHIVMGRDYVREAVQYLAEKGVSVDSEMQLRLEHVILSHQNLPEWGSPKTMMTPEALLVHYSDDIDAKFYIMYTALMEVTESEEFTNSKNPLRLTVFRGLKNENSQEKD
ncbi:MAG: HD domain-containing protein [Planctomycetia bacterium]|nr:HD domain-containing protein [Planctomycetia bacterium]